MPKILDRLVGQLEAKGKSQSASFAIANSVLNKAGDLKGGKLTAKGAQRQAMGAEGRAKDRAASASGRSAKDYSYSKRTNRATLKGK